jgi:hypothetical protein
MNFSSEEISRFWETHPCGNDFVWFHDDWKKFSRLMNEPIERLERHLKNLKSYGISYLKIKNFIHKATDGPDNVFSAVFSEKEAKTLFSSIGFVNIKFRKHFINERHFPIIKDLLPASVKRKIASRWGWHLWCFGEKPMIKK